MKNILLPFLILLSLTATAQEEQLADGANHWYLPDHMKLQFAGNIGFMSGGPGYSSKNKTLETDILFGFLPQKFGGDALISTTLKTTYSPWLIALKNEHYFAPFSLGMYLSYTFGPQFDTKWPSYYPRGYYWWATAFRPGAYIGGKVGRTVNTNKRKRGLELYYELGSYDLMMISYVQNTGFLKLSDIVNLAFGVKFGF
ncbi:hypothetical protein [Dyadobacter psychrotolerans]|uniref:Outer membrane protein beta-barrel domain-containing protein n=1 Tax=Dyadobacter psychrotolerans TaxID=2541721 RepID=A0A4R5DRM3_9BACT|nr:hypothetical protein [Dyadobacter psychrotolerans]TDE14711.1 hypothetical protein E0F88_16115 [Dyadobacter psychrotolerans]